MLTILHTESSKGWGGQENRTLKESIGLKKMGARVIIACSPDSRLYEYAIKNGIEVKGVEINKGFSLYAIFSLLKIIKRENVDIISTHSGKDSLAGGIAGRISSRKPAIVRTRHLALPITSKLTYSLLPHRVVTVSDYVRKYLVEDKRIPRHKVISIPTGIDLEIYNPDNVTAFTRDEFGCPQNSIIVGSVAILRRKKGHHTILDAVPLVLRELPETMFLFAGDGPQRENIENRIKELNIEKNVKIIGLRQDIPQFLKTIDIFVLPTLQEALGTSFLEAMAMNKPVIGTKVGGVPEIVKHGTSGLLVEPEQPEALANAIVEICKNKKMMTEMGIEGKKIVEQGYSVEVMNKRLFEFYKTIIAERQKL